MRRRGRAFQPDTLLHFIMFARPVMRWACLGKASKRLATLNVGAPVSEGIGESDRLFNMNYLSF